MRLKHLHRFAGQLQSNPSESAIRAFQLLKSVSNLKNLLAQNDLGQEIKSVQEGLGECERIRLPMAQEESVVVRSPEHRILASTKRAK